MDRMLFSQPKNIDADNATYKLLDKHLKSKNPATKAAAIEELEKRLVTMQGKCPDEIVENLRVRTFQFSPELIHSYIEDAATNVFDHNFQDGLGCLIDALLSNNADDEHLHIDLRKWITNIHNMGDSSKLEKDSYPLFAFKRSEDFGDDYDLTHEALVGLGAINTLRDRIPTFMHTYAASMCTAPLLNKKGLVTVLCPSKEPDITYLVLENIADSRPLAKEMDKLNRDGFLQILLQVLNALNIANKAFKFTHYNLNADNVLIQTLPYMISVPLYIDGKILYIITDKLVRIIDYSTAYIELQGYGFARFGLEDNGVKDVSNPMYDVKTLLRSMKNRNIQNDIDVMSGLINSDIVEKSSTTRIHKQHYGKEKLNTLDDMIISIIQSYNLMSVAQVGNLSFPNEDKTVPRHSFIVDSRPLGRESEINLLETLQVSNRFIVQNQPADVIATICKDNCMTWDGFIQHVFDQTKLPTSLRQYCQANRAVDAFSFEPYRSQFKEWLSQVSIQNLYDEESTEFQEKFTKTINKINKIDLKKVNSKRFSVDDYKKNIGKMVKILGKIKGYETWIKSAICAFQYKKEYSEISDYMEEVFRGLGEVKELIKVSMSVIKFNLENYYRYGIKFDKDLEAKQNIIITFV